MHTIYCDESGYNGGDLLQLSQPYFVYSGVRLNEILKEEINKLLRENYPVQREIKGIDIVQNDRGKRAILKIFQNYSHLARIVFCNKKYALAAKIFEYAVEPYLLSNQLVYESDFHKFIAAKLYSTFKASNNEAENLFLLFSQALRGKNALNLSELKTTKDKIWWWIIDLVKSDLNIFNEEIYTDSEIDKWVLDLTSTSLIGILTEWSKNGDILNVICDGSNLFKENDLIDNLNNIGRANGRANFLGQTIGFGLEKDIQFAKSKNDIGLQIADIFASTVFYCLKNKDVDFSKNILSIVLQNCLCNPATFCVEVDLTFKLNKQRVDFYYKLMKIISQNNRASKNTGAIN